MEKRNFLILSIGVKILSRISNLYLDLMGMGEKAQWERCMRNEQEDPSSMPRTLIRKPSVVVPACNISTKEADTAGFLEPSRQPN